MHDQDSNLGWKLQLSRPMLLQAVLVQRKAGTEQRFGNSLPLFSLQNSLMLRDTRMKYTLHCLVGSGVEQSRLFPLPTLHLFILGNIGDPGTCVTEGRGEDKMRKRKEICGGELSSCPETQEALWR